MTVFYTETKLTCYLSIWSSLSVADKVFAKQANEKKSITSGWPFGLAAPVILADKIVSSTIRIT